MERDSRVETLIQNAQRGDREAFDELIQLYDARIRALVESRVGKSLRQEVEVEDVLQETLLRAFRSIAQFRWDGEDSFLRWLGGILTHVIQSLVRRPPRRGQVPLEVDVAASGVSPSRAERRVERFDRLEDALRTLSPEHRQVILLARIEKLPIQEIAVRMGRSADAITNLLRRAVRNLKATFGDTGSFRLPPRTLSNGASANGASAKGDSSHG